MEAHDKKQVAEDTLTEPKGMQAIVSIHGLTVGFASTSAVIQVPAQPNYCDCGIYLLHFAKTFMKDPKVSSDIICSVRTERVIPPPRASPLTFHFHIALDAYKRSPGPPRALGRRLRRQLSQRPGH